MESASGETDLLQGPDAFISCENGPVSRLMGVYLYYDTQDRAFVRAGKTNRAFVTRHEEHRRAACLTTLEDLASRFYTYVCQGPHCS